MIEKSLETKLKRVFGVSRVTFAAPGESLEQGIIFVEVESIRNSIKDTRHHARITGRLSINAQSQNVPFGYFAKRIAEADAADTIDFFFFDFEENAIRFQNLVTRSLSFVFFFNEQYNPEVGIMNEINFQEVIE